ncbi:MAG: hypothetical protein KDI13_11015 [Alphaproteobacteria bacterium]|nr:hypothetical protein [Alphaproteobacteria bacterium]
MIVNTKKQKRLATVNEVAAMPEYPFSKSSLRHLIFQAEDRLSSKGDTIPGNGLKEAGAIIRIGKKILVDLDRFDAWIENQRAG